MIEYEYQKEALRRLGDKPSVGLRQALNDLESVESDQKYLVEMSVWHSPLYARSQREVCLGQCEVCLAGAVLARSGMPPHRRYEDDITALGSISDELRLRMFAIDEFRTGRVRGGLAFWYMGHSAIRDRVLEKYDMTYEPAVHVTLYDFSRSQFYHDMKKVITMLEEVGE